MICITLPPAPDLTITLGLPSKWLQPNADLGMPRDLEVARRRIGAINAARRALEADAMEATSAAVLRAGVAIQPAGVVLLPVFCWPSTRSKSARDFDNASASLKKAQDGIAKGLGLRSDRRVRQLPPIFDVDKQKPRVEIAIYFDTIKWSWA